MSNPFQKIKIVKLFASNEYKTRNKAHKVITKLLKFDFGNGQRQINENDILGIWKGLYMWLWMQDKPILHEEVIGKICKLLSEIQSEKVAFEFINAFYTTMMREWKKIDVHRVDKFYMLTRDFFGTVLSWCHTDARVENIVSYFASHVINGVIDQGIEFKMHLIDILIDELVRAQSSSKLTTGLLLASIRSVAALSQKNVYVLRMTKRVLSRIIPLYNESKLKIDLIEIGKNALEMAETEGMFRKTKKMFYHMSTLYLTCKRVENGADEEMADEDCEETEAAETENCNEDATMADEVESEEEEEDNTVAPEMADTEEETASEDGEEAPPPPKNDRPALKRSFVRKLVRQETVVVNHGTPTKAHTAAETRDRKVTFGKKYTKKFKKTDVNVAMSLGTTKNEQMKSILKKKKQ